MPYARNDPLAGVCRESLQSALERHRRAHPADKAHLPLTDAQQQLLAKKLLALPAEYLHILLFRYCFHATPAETEELLGIENALGKQRYIHQALSSLMEMENALIDDRSMKRACGLALGEYTDYRDLPITARPKYSYGFQRKLKKIRAAQRFPTVVLLAVKYAAAFLLTCAVGFSAAFALNADFRERVVDWVVQTFPQFSSFSWSETESEDLPGLSAGGLTVGYVPEGFVLSDSDKMHSMIIYHYAGAQGGTMTIIFAANATFYSDTEDAEITETLFKGNSSFYWQKEGRTHFIWSQDGLACQIIASLDLDTVMKIAENITAS